MQTQTTRSHATSYKLSAHLIMFAVLLATYSINAMDRQSFPLVIVDVRRAFNFTLAEAGFLSTIFTLGMAVSGLLTTFLLDRLSRKAVVILGILMFSAGTGLTAVAHGFSDMCFYLAFTGIGEAMHLTTIIAIATCYLPSSRSIAIGSVNFSYGLGSLLGPLLGAKILLRAHDWRAPLVALAFIGFLAAATVSFILRPSFTEMRGVVQTVLEETRGAPNLSNRNTVLLALISVIGGLVIYGYLGMYPTYLREHLHFSPRDTSVVMSMYGVGALASLGGGWLGDRLSPRTVLTMAFTGVAVLGYLFFHLVDSVSGQAMLSLTWGAIVSGVLYVNLAGYHIKAVRSSLSHRAAGIFVTSLYASASLAGYMIGFIASRAGWKIAGETQFCLLSMLAIGLTVALRPRDMALKQTIHDDLWGHVLRVNENQISAPSNGAEATVQKHSP